MFPRKFRPWRLILIGFAAATLLALSTATYRVLRTFSDATLIYRTILPNTIQPANNIHFRPPPNHSATTNSNFLDSYGSLFNSHFGSDLLAPTFDSYTKNGTLGGNATTAASTDLSYGALYYGEEPGDGGIAFLNPTGITGDHTFASNGSGPNRLGGLLPIRLFPNKRYCAPDGGATVAMFAAALLGLGATRRCCKR